MSGVHASGLSTSQQNRSENTNAPTTFTSTLCERRAAVHRARVAFATGSHRHPNPHPSPVHWCRLMLTKLLGTKPAHMLKLYPICGVGKTASSGGSKRKRIWFRKPCPQDSRSRIGAPESLMLLFVLLHKPCFPTQRLHMLGVGATCKQRRRVLLRQGLPYWH